HSTFRSQQLLPGRSTNLSHSPTKETSSQASTRRQHRTEPESSSIDRSSQTSFPNSATRQASFRWPGRLWSCCPQSSYPCSSHRLSSCWPTISRERTSSSKPSQPSSSAHLTSQPSHGSRWTSSHQSSSRSQSTASSTSSSSTPIRSP